MFLHDGRLSLRVHFTPPCEQIRGSGRYSPKWIASARGSAPHAIHLLFLGGAGGELPHTGERLSSGCSRLARVLLALRRVICLRLGQIAFRILHEVSLGLLAAEAVGLSANLLVDRAVRGDVLAERKAHRTHIVVLAGDGQSRRGHAEQEGAGKRRHHNLSHDSLSLPIAADLCLPLPSALPATDQ